MTTQGAQSPDTISEFWKPVAPSREPNDWFAILPQSEAFAYSEEEFDRRENERRAK